MIEWKASDRLGGSSCSAALLCVKPKDGCYEADLGVYMPVSLA
jgi:hypothetical protein